MSTWYLLNKIVATVFIVLTFFIITFYRAFDGMGTGLGQMVGKTVGRACPSSGASQGGSARLLGLVAPFLPLPPTTRSFWRDGSCRAFRGRLVRFPCCPDEFPRTQACGWARPGQGGCLPDILSLWIHKERRLGELGAPTCLLAQQTSARKGPGAPSRRHQTSAPAWPGS